MWRRRKVFKFSPDRMMASIHGGMSLAMIGADGAGKSTMCQMLAEWLTGRLDVRSYYLGSKQPSRRSELLYILFRMARRSQRGVGRRLGEGHVLSRWMAELRDSLLCTHHLSIGRDRARRCRAGRKAAMAGSIVIFDRYPLELISTEPGFRLLDGPQIPLTVGEETGTIRRALARAEQDLYHDMRLPDTLFVLDVGPDVSLQRKPDHNRATVEAKIRAVNELMAMADADASEFSVVHLNANLPFEDVSSQLRAKIWEVL
jgi:thymidylate kinase